MHSPVAPQGSQFPRVGSHNRRLRMHDIMQVLHVSRRDHQGRMDTELEVRQLEVRLLRLLAASRRSDAFTDARAAALGRAASELGAAHEAALARLAAVQTAGEAAQQRLTALQQVRTTTTTYLRVEY